MVEARTSLVKLILKYKAFFVKMIMFSIELSQHLYRISIDHICVGFFMDCIMPLIHVLTFAPVSDDFNKKGNQTMEAGETI